MEKEMKVRYSRRHPNAYEVYFEGGGEVPSVLSGSYTSPGVAQKAIDQYMVDRPARRSTKSKV